MDLRVAVKAAKPIVIAHRGNSGPAPANTMESIRQAVELGVDMIELDVRRSRDGVPVLIHNDTVDETTNSRRKFLYQSRGVPWPKSCFCC